MYFGWFIKDWLSQVPANIVGAALKTAKTVFFSLNTHIYKLIIDLYNMFIKLCTTRLLSSELLSQIANRIGLVLGIVMLFFVILSFIQMLLNPDVINDKEKGATSVIKKVIIVIVMFGSSSFFFQTLFDIQQLVIKSNLISKLLLPYSITTTIGEYDNSNDTPSNNAVMDDTNFGGLLSEELFMSFYKLEEFKDGDGNGSFEIEEQEVYDACKSTIIGFRMQIVNYGLFDLGYNCLNEEVTGRYKVDGNESDPQEKSIVDFNWPLATLCGIVVVYLLFMYCLKIGVRMVQLMFLEIISSMAFVSYLSPKKDTMFDKWKKIYFSTYVDVFIRIAIINFVFFLIATVFSNGGEEGLVFVGEGSGSFFNVVMILALLTFAKRAPELLKELLGPSASKLGFGASSKDIFGLNPLVAGLAGYGIGTLGRLPGAVSNTVGAIGRIPRDVKSADKFSKKAWAAFKGTGRALGTGIGSTFGVAFGGVSGAARGGYAGLNAKGGMLSAARTGQQTAAKANLTAAQRSGIPLSERASDAAKGFFGIQGGNAALSSELSMSNEIKSTLEKEDIIKHIDEMRQSYIQAMAQRGEVVSAAVLKDYDDKKKDAMRQMYEAAYKTDQPGATTVSVTLQGLDGNDEVLTETYDSNRGIHNQIRDNEKRAGKQLASWSAYKEDNNELKNRIAGTHKSGS